MPALAVDLIGLGIAPQPAARLGWGSSTTLAGVGTAQVGAKAIKNGVTNVLATTSSGQTAFVLPSDAELMVPYIVYNSTSDAALVFPPSGGAINAAGANASVSIAVTLARIFLRRSTNVWISFLAA